MNWRAFLNWRKPASWPPPLQVDDTARRCFAQAILETLAEPPSHEHYNALFDRAAELDPRLENPTDAVGDPEFKRVVYLADDYCDALNDGLPDLDDWLGRPAEQYRVEMKAWAEKTLSALSSDRPED